MTPQDSLLTAYGRMKLYDISQIPVLDESGQVVGLIDESDILLAVFKHQDRFKDPVATAMTKRLETLQADQPMEALLPVFDRGPRRHRLRRRQVPRPDHPDRHAEPPQAQSAVGARPRKAPSSRGERAGVALACSEQLGPGFAPLLKREHQPRRIPEGRYEN